MTMIAGSPHGGSHCLEASKSPSNLGYFGAHFQSSKTKTPRRQSTGLALDNIGSKSYSGCFKTHVLRRSQTRSWLNFLRHDFKSCRHAVACSRVGHSICSASAAPQVIIQGDTQEEVYERLVDRVLATAQASKRVVVGVAGVPGSGKTTTADEVVARIHKRLGVQADASPAIAVSMDGYHYYRKELDGMEDPAALHARRGAHWTFNAEAFVEAMLRVKGGGPVPLPTFQHGVGDPVEDGVQLLESHTIVLVEGNYVLLDVAPWDQLAHLFDDSWYVDTDIDTALERLMQRQMRDNKRSEEEVRARIASNDRPNAELVHAVSRRRADVIVSPIPSPPPA